MQTALYIAAMPEPEANTGYSRKDLLTMYWQTRNGTSFQPEQYLHPPTLDAFRSLHVE